MHRTMNVKKIIMPVFADEFILTFFLCPMTRMSFKEYIQQIKQVSASSIQSLGYRVNEHDAFNKKEISPSPKHIELWGPHSLPLMGTQHKSVKA